MENQPKVLLSCPTYQGKDYIIDRYIDRIKNLTYSNYDIFLVDLSNDNGEFMEKIKSKGINVVKGKWNEQSKIRMTNAQNLIRQKVLDEGYDYFFSLECDLIPPVDIIEKLLSYNKDVISGWYYIGESPRPCLSRTWELVDMKFSPRPVLLTAMAQQPLMKVFLGSFGCSLIKREVLEKIKFKAYKLFTQHADTWFYFDCEKLGIDVYVVTELLIPHFQDHIWKGILDRDKEIELESMRLKEEDLD